MTVAATSQDLAPLPRAHAALDRMRVAFREGRGVRLSWEDLASLHATTIGQMWEEENPLMKSGQTSAQCTYCREAAA